MASSAHVACTVALLGSSLLVGVAGGGAAGDGLPEDITGMEFVTRVQHNGGAGLWLHEGFAYSSANNGGFFVTDVRDPEHPVKMGSITGIYMRDADVVEVGSRVIVVTSANGNGLHTLDVTNPAQPRRLATIDVGITHNLAAVPGTTLVYGARGGSNNGGNAAIDIFDVGVPEAPRLVKTWTTPDVEVNVESCHDITVYPEVDRAYCAGGFSGQDLVLGIADPVNPVVLSVLSNPLITFHHWAMPNQDHTLLILGDEAMGTSAPGCIASATTPAGTVSTPTGAVWFYDISDLANPVLLSWVSPPFAGTVIPCTAHFGRLIGDRAMVAVGWYRAGIVLIDFSNPLLPRIVDDWIEGADAWDVHHEDGYLFTGDINRGMDVLRLVGGGGAQADAPPRALRMLPAAAGLDPGMPYSCTLDGPLGGGSLHA